MLAQERGCPWGSLRSIKLSCHQEAEGAGQWGGTRACRGQGHHGEVGRLDDKEPNCHVQLVGPCVWGASRCHQLPGYRGGLTCSFLDPGVTRGLRQSQCRAEPWALLNLLSSRSLGCRRGPVLHAICWKRHPVPPGWARGACTHTAAGAVLLLGHLRARPHHGVCAWACPAPLGPCPSPLSVSGSPGSPICPSVRCLC